jgi:hypothetical protein
MKQTRLERLTKIMDYLAKRGTNKEWVNDAYRNAQPKITRL